jgi:hypothetical protein
MTAFGERGDGPANARVESVPDIPAACTLTPGEKERKAAHLQKVGESLVETVERADGYAFRFPPELFDELARIVGLERRCCAFPRFSLKAEPGNGPVWLEITGSPESKAFVATFWE